MHCIVLSSPKGKQAWYIRRSVEILAYHRRLRLVRIIFGLLAKSLLRKGGQNFLRIMHRGNVRFRMLQPWPLPRHPDEPEAGESILQRLYGRAFEFDKKECRIYRHRLLSPADTWRPDARTPVTAWCGKCKPEASPSLGAGNSYTPFMSWELGPFEEPGYYLIAFAIDFSGETYKRLVEQRPFFTIDGPQRLLDEVEYGDLVNLPPIEQRAWGQLLRQYKDRVSRLDVESYDVVVLGAGMADEVAARVDRIERVENLARISGACEAPIQPDLPYAKRFLTFDQFFTIALKYATSESELESSELTATT